MKLNLGIIGYGFVGKALEKGFKFLDNYKLINNINIYDPKIFPNNKIDSLLNCEYVFVCVPTPMSSSGEIDIKIIDSVLNELNSINFKNTIVLKSTITPMKVTEVIRKYDNLKIITNPEFLTERSATKDFISSPWIVVGDNNDYSDDLILLYKSLWPNSKLVTIGVEAAMMAKYMTNCWFASKVSLMNEFKVLWDVIGDDNWNDVVTAFGYDDRVGPTHLQVPGPDGDYGFGGKCFAKDINAMMYMCKVNNVPFNVMKGAWTTNNLVRTNKDWLKIDGAVSEDYSETNYKRSIFWFVDIKDMDHVQSSAKLRQLSDYSQNLKFDNIDNIYIIGADENKICISETEAGAKEYFKDESAYLKWLNEIKSKLKECITICL